VGAGRGSLIEPMTKELSRYFLPARITSLIEASRLACIKGLLNGLNGNLSIRQGDSVLITRSGSAKGLLSVDDLCILDLESGRVLAGKKPPSSESGMHLEIYKNQPGAGAVAHTHPVSVLTLDGLAGDSILQNINLFEAEAIRSRLASVPGHPPGTARLASAVGFAAREHDCIIMRSHGLTSWGESPAQAVALCDELEALARIELNILMLGNRH
jgi:L-fuculose-phosphate aldolase